jgi:hypothetical protein
MRHAVMTKDETDKEDRPINVPEDRLVVDYCSWLYDHSDAISAALNGIVVRL